MMYSLTDTILKHFLPFEVLQREQRVNGLNFEEFEEGISGCGIGFSLSFTGSFAEGLYIPPHRYTEPNGRNKVSNEHDLPDIDIMLMYKPTEYELEIVTIQDENYENYGMIRITKPSNKLRNISVKIDDEHYLKSLDFPQRMLSLFNLQEEWGSNTYNVHGPCFQATVEGFELDFCFALLFDGWPEIADNWKRRTRPLNWPSPKLKYAILDKGFCMVPTGRGTCSSDQHAVEWRYSFSIAEKMLAKTLNMIQIQAYIFLKLIRKKQFNANQKKKVPTYYLKTLLLWACEKDESMWSDASPASIIHTLMDKFLACLRRRELEHYFVTSVNLFHSLSDQEANAMIGILTPIRWNLPDYVLAIDEIIQFPYIRCETTLRECLGGMNVQEQLTKDDYSMILRNIFCEYSRTVASDLPKITGVEADVKKGLEESYKNVSIQILAHIVSEYIEINNQTCCACDFIVDNLKSIALEIPDAARVVHAILYNIGKENLSSLVGIDREYYDYIILNRYHGVNLNVRSMPKMLLTSAKCGIQIEDDKPTDVSEMIKLEWDKLSPSTTNRLSILRNIFRGYFSRDNSIGSYSFFSLMCVLKLDDFDEMMNIAKHHGDDSKQAQDKYFPNMFMFLFKLIGRFDMGVLSEISDHISRILYETDFTFISNMCRIAGCIPSNGNSDIMKFTIAMGELYRSGAIGHCWAILKAMANSLSTENMKCLWNIIVMPAGKLDWDHLMLLWFEIFGWLKSLGKEELTNMICSISGLNIDHPLITCIVELFFFLLQCDRAKIVNAFDQLMAIFSWDKISPKHFLSE